MSDIIDINVGETIEEVTINVTDNLITVNINKVTGGGGTQTLAETLDLGNTTGGENISISNGDAIILDNGSMLKKGTIDAGNGGSKGISQICSVGYEHKWEAGRLYIMNDGGTTIREVSHNFTNVPTATDDVTKGFVQNTRWILDNGDVYVCTDPTEDAAVWSLLNTIPTLQEVTDAGYETTNPIKAYQLVTQTNGGTKTMTLSSNNVEEEHYAEWQNKDYTGIADISDIIPQVNSDWNATSGVEEILNKPTIPTNTSDLTNDGADGVNPFITALDIPTTGQASTLVREVKNMTGATLTKGTVVFISGANGNKPLVSKALATTDALSSRTFGLLQSDINNNGTGNCVIIGDLSGLNTSSFSEGDQLYLSGVTAGAFTSTRTLAPTHLVYVGKITRSHPTQGQIEVGIQNGYELSEIHDVALSSEANNQALVYETSTELWKNKTIIEDAIVNGVTAIAPSQNAVFDALALKQAVLSYTPYRNIQTSQTVHTGTTSETLIFTALIPAGAFNSNDIIKVLYGANKTTNLGTYTLRLRVNTTTNIATAPTIAIYTGSASIQSNVVMRNYHLIGGNLLAHSFSTTAITDIFASPGLSSTTLNPANQFYIFFTITLNNAGDSIIGNMLSISN
jgi:hypothetical protein